MYGIKFGHLIVLMTSLTLILPLSYKTVQANWHLYLGWPLIFEADETNNTPPVASGDTYTMSEDTILNVLAPGVLGNDSDADNDPISAFIVSLPGQGSLTLNNDGGFVYSPNPNYNGSDSFTYVANDGEA
ncbi:MAG: Ig-like domain-containing protein, partial [Thermanaerothrix sp.]|nr:Ig-like domain-containing protein [Thermanaerothrix sp.]